MFETHQKLFALAGLFLVLGLARCAQQRGRPGSPSPATANPCGAQSLDWDLRLRRGDVQALRARTLEETGLLVQFEPPHADLFEFFKDHHFVPLDEPRQQALAIRHVQQAAREYRPRLLPKVLTHVVVVERLWRWDMPIGGYASPRERLIFTTWEGLLERDTFHHEVGHLLEARWFDPSWRLSWLSENEPEWQYPYGADVRGKLTGRRVGNPLERGFVSSYGSTAFEEDVAEYFELLMGCPDRLEDLAGRHERIGRKRDLLVAFADRIEATEVPLAR